MNQEGVLVSCAVCKQLTQRRCSRCISIYYCSTEHQRQDWRRHKSECIPKLTQRSDNNKVKESTLGETGSKKQDIDSVQSAKQVNNQGEANPESSARRRSKKSKKKGVKQDNSSAASSKQTSQVSSENTPRTNNSAEHNSLQPGSSSVPDNSVTSSIVYTTKDLNEESAITYEGSSEQEILSESAQQLSTVDFVGSNSLNVMREVNRTDPRMISIPSYRGDQPSRVREYPEASLRGSSAPFNCMPNSYRLDPNDSDYETCQRVISDMTQYGVCVLDNFMGYDIGLKVLDDVVRLYTHGQFSPGQLVSNAGSKVAHSVRSDYIAWVDGREPECTHIKQLIAKVDGIIIKANKMANNGKMGDYIINGRTKAMVACYPGYGSHYVKHVDNPNKDGRCITAIYYLNQKWDVRRNGGLLRVFPEGTNQVADIAPIFDRMLFFWSDRRNPHEVQPAFHTRYAITLWYFDAQERADARRNFKERGQPESNQ